MTGKKSKKIIVFISVICILITAGILGCFFVPQLFARNAIQINHSQGEQKKCDFNNEYKSFVKTSSGELYVNEKTSAVAIADKTGEVVFNSHSEDAAENKLACVLSVILRDKTGNSYIKNSSINSVELGNFKVTSKKKNTVTITFSFAEDKEGNISEIIPVKFSEENGGFKVEIDMDEVTLKDGFSIE